MVAETTERGTFDAPAHMRKIKTRQGMVDYLDVKFRVLWLRAEHPDASIVTEAIYANEREACMKATVSYALGERVVMATGHGSETAADFPSGHIEKAETKAIGRACAVLGYGTDAAADFDDGEPMDGRAAAKDERAARGGDEPTRLDDRQRKQVDAQHERNATPPRPEPSRLPSTRRPTPAPDAPMTDALLSVRRDIMERARPKGIVLYEDMDGEAMAAAIGAAAAEKRLNVKTRTPDGKVTSATLHAALGAFGASGQLWFDGRRDVPPPASEE